MKSSFLTRDQALSLWSRSTDSKTLDYQGTNIKEYQIVRTHTNRPLEYKTQHHPNTSSTLCRTPHLSNKQNKNTNPVISRQDDHLTQPCPSEEKNKHKNSAQISPYRKLTQTTGPSLGRQKPKGRKNSTFLKERIQFNFPRRLGKGDLKHNKLKKMIMKNQRNTMQTKEQTRSKMSK